MRARPLTLVTHRTQHRVALAPPADRARTVAACPPPRSLVLAARGSCSRPRPRRPARRGSGRVRGEVVTPYRNGDDPYAGGQHRGIDIAAPVGAPVVAAAGGARHVRGRGRLLRAHRRAPHRRRALRHLVPAPVVASVCARATRSRPGERLGAVGTSGSPLGRSAAPPLRRPRRRQPPRYRDPLDFLAPPPPAAEPSAGPGAGAGAAARVPVGRPSPARRRAAPAPRPGPAAPRARAARHPRRPCRAPARHPRRAPWLAAPRPREPRTAGARGPSSPRRSDPRRRVPRRERTGRAAGRRPAAPRGPSAPAPRRPGRGARRAASPIGAEPGRRLAPPAPAARWPRPSCGRRCALGRGGRRAGARQ